MPVQIIGVNQIGFDGANDLMTEGADLPWLQEDAAHPVWDDWSPVYRDVIILDGDNVEVATFNLTDQSLGEQANYDALRQLFVDAADTL